MTKDAHPPARSAPPLLCGLSLGLVGITIGFALGRWLPLDAHDGTQRRVYLEQALITSVQGTEYRVLLPSSGDPLAAVRNRYPALAVDPPVIRAFGNRDNGYVLLMWLGALPDTDRQEFLLGLGLVVDETDRRQGDRAHAINTYHHAYIQARTENDA